MKYFVSALIFTVFALPAAAQEREKLLKQAQQLERKAEALLEQGKRGQAFDMLARAAELRERARAAPEKKAQKKAAKKKRKAKPAGKPAVEQAFKVMDAALKQGDLTAARKAAVRLRELLGLWERQLEAKEQVKAVRSKADDARLLQRIEALERQVRELRLELAPPGAHVTALRARVAELEAQLGRDLAMYEEGSARIRQLRAELEAARLRLKALDAERAERIRNR
jgi:exonuclease VII small subunit